MKRTFVHAEADSEAVPVAEKSVDLVLACLGLHWVNDLPGAMLQVRNAYGLAPCLCQIRHVWVRISVYRLNRLRVAAKP